MLPAICVFVLSVSSFGSDSIEAQIALIEDRVCELFAEEEVVVVEVVEEVPAEVEEPVAEVTESEIVEAEVVEAEVVEAEVVEAEVVEVVEPNLAPELMPETEMIEPATAAPPFEIVEEEIAGHVAVVEAEEVVEVTVADESEMTQVSDIEELLGAWPQLSEETRESILLLIRIDNSVE